MSSDSATTSFVAYLTCGLPFGYPSEPPITPQFLETLRERQRKELVLQQAAFYETANAFAGQCPWIAYIAALKHEAVLAAIPIELPQFVQVTDQKIFNDCHLNWRRLRNESRPAIEDGIAFFCERLIQLQREAWKIDGLENTLRSALAAGFTALLPLDETPPELPKGLGANLASAVGLDKERREEIEAKIKAWHRQDSYLQLALRTLNKISSLPFETRQNGLKNVPGCLEALKGLREEREILIANYITPYVT